MAKVLMFHRVLPEKQITQPNAYSTFGTLISQEYFEKVLSLLTENGFQFVTVSELSKYNDTAKLVALTFDDGFEPAASQEMLDTLKEKQVKGFEKTHLKILNPKSISMG